MEAAAEFRTPQVLIIDDESDAERRIADFIQLGLIQEGFTVQSVHDARNGFAAALGTTPDLIILDLTLPATDNITMYRHLREAGCATPIIIITAKEGVMAGVAGLNEGAADYLTKPFTFEELLARIRAVLRRTQPAGADPLGSAILYFDTLRLDLQSRTVYRAGHEIALTSREIDLLAYFMQHPRQVLYREAILTAVWGYDFFGDTNIIEVYVRYLRRKLGEPRLIHTVRGIGYVLRHP